jgi:hypothetical protein
MYQGHLKESGVPMNGSTDMRFRLFNAEVGGFQVGPEVAENGVPLDNGNFAVEVDFGSGVFTGLDLYLETRVRNNQNNWITLSPRQHIAPVPYAIHAQSANWSGLTGMPAGFADGTDDMELPFAGSYAGSDSNALAITQTGLGGAGYFSSTDAGNYWEALFAVNYGTGSCIKGLKPPNTIGYVAEFENLGTSNSLPAIRAKTNGGGAALHADGGANGYGVTANSSGPGNALQTNASGTGLAGKFDGQDNDGTTATIKIISGSQEMLIDGNEIDTTVDLHINHNSPEDVIMATGGGRVGIGTQFPNESLQVGSISTPGAEGMIRLASRAAAGSSNRQWNVGVGNNDSSTTGFSFQIDDLLTPEKEFFIKWGTGQVGIGTFNIPSDVKLAVDGKTKVDVLEIAGGSDLSEGFGVGGENVEPGMVVVIDPVNAGRLQPSTEAYDTRVAGIISGAGGVNIGMLMGQDGTMASGDHPVALTGRVYCYVDATELAVVPGDLLTTSDLRGHAMKAVDRERCGGAILGKAMTPLALGQRGLVLVLVSLQ